MTRPLLEIVARAICNASGANPDQPVYRNQCPESGILYLKWSVYRTEAEAAIRACRVNSTRDLLKRLTAPYTGDPDGEPLDAIVKDAVDLLAKLDAKAAGEVV
jgi:hypothetical protein